MRRSVPLVAAAAATTLLVGLLGAPGASAAGSSSGSAGGRYAKVSPRRVLDTRTGAYGNRKGALRAGKSVSVRVSGRSGVPAGAAAVVLTVGVLSPTRSGVVAASPLTSHRPAVATVSFTAGHPAADLAVVPVHHGRVRLWNLSHGSVHLTADVSGYYTGGTAGAGHALHTVKPARLVDTRHGTAHNRRGAVRAGRTFSPQLTGRDGIPRTASAVLATVTVMGARTGGTVSALTDGGDTPPPSIQVSAKRQVSQFVLLPLAANGRVTIANHTRGAVQIAVDVAGYLADGPSDEARVTQVDEAARAATVTVRPHHTKRIGITGHAGVPRSSVSSAIVTLRVLDAPADGTLRTSAGAAPTAVQFAKGTSASGVSFAGIDSHGRIELSTSSHKPVKVEVDVDGYVPTRSVAAAAHPARARYLSDLTGNSAHDAQSMGEDGAADGRAGARFVLLDVGAQSVTKPLSASDPGVSLVLTHTRVTLSYAQLDADVLDYVNAFRTAAGTAAVTVAVGTNNDGVWAAKKKNYYAPAARGRAWADKVVDALRAEVPSGVTVLGADDIEAAFASTESQAQAWEDAFLDATPARLVDNGDANGCPRTPGVTGRACAYGWTQADYHHLASDRGRTLALPQVFYPADAVKWANIDAAGSHRLDFLGSLTEHGSDPSTATPASGRAALYRALSSVRSSVSLPYAVDV